MQPLEIADDNVWMIIVTIHIYISVVRFRSNASDCISLLICQLVSGLMLFVMVYSLNRTYINAYLFLMMIFVHRPANG